MTAPADPHAEARAAIVARYGSEAAALRPCEREAAMREGTWSIVVPGNPETGPSLMGWRDGPASTMPLEVRRDVSTAIPRPVGSDAVAAEAAYWTERAETLEALGAPPLPVWVRARRAILKEILGAPPPVAPAPPASAAQEGETAVPPPSPPLDSAPIAAMPPPDGASAAASEPGDPPADEAGTGSDGAPSVDQATPALDPETGAETEPVQSGQPARTREEARAAVRALLGEPLTDREIARRVGVSPSTVAAVRKANP